MEIEQNHSELEFNSNLNPSGLVSVGYFPHGTMSLDASAPGLPEGSVNLHNAMKKVAERLVESDAELIILSTPHGLNLTSSLGIYMNGTASGSAEWNGNWTEFNVDVQLNLEAAKDLYEHLTDSLQSNELGVEGISFFSGCDAKLRWGEVVPLWFIEQAFKSSNKKPPKYIIISQPRGYGKTYEQTIQRRQEFYPSLRKCGQLIGEWITKYSQNKHVKIAIAISGDLAHTHPYNTDVREEYKPADLVEPSDKAEVFDHTIENWIKSSDWETIQEAAKIEAEAKSCGFTGIIFLHGVLEHFGWCKKGQVLANEHPTYYGMIVGHW